MSKILRIIRSIAAVLGGYFVFVAATLAFFKGVNQPPHEAAPVQIMLGSIVVGVAAAFLGGYLAALLAGNRPVGHGAAVSLVLALGAAISLASTLGHGAVWSQISALALMVPSAVAGGWVRSRQLGGA